MKKQESIQLNFMIAGHTKFSVDYGFGFIKKKFRVTKVSSIYDIAKVQTFTSSIIPRLFPLLQPAFHI